MAAVKLTVHSISNGKCSLSEREGEVLNVSFDDGTTKESNLSHKSFLQLLKMKCAQDSRPAAPASPGPVLQRPQGVPSVVPMATANQVK